MSCHRIQWTNARIHRSEKIARVKSWFSQNNYGQIPPSAKERKEWTPFLEQGWREPEIESLRENMLCQLAIRASPVDRREWQALQAQLAKMDREQDPDAPSKLAKEIRAHVLEFLRAHQVSLKKFQKHLVTPETSEITRRIIRKMHQQNRNHNLVIATRASWYERQIEQVLSSQGIAFKTEHDLRLMDPNARCTPDIWFPDPITIYLDGKSYQIYWIDAKSMVGTQQFSMQLSGLKKQSKKYLLAFGPGAFVFHFGFDAGLPAQLPETLILDYLPSDPVPGCRD